MSVTKVRACSSIDAMLPEQQSLKPEKEGQDPLDNIIKQAIGKESFLSFSSAGDGPVRWMHLFNHQGSTKVAKGSRVENGVGGKEHFLELCNGLSSEMNGVKEFIHPPEDGGGPAKGKKSTSEQMQALKIPEAVVAFAQAAAKANGEPEKYLAGWPLLSPSKVQLLKCDKCSREFCSPINYRRHVRVHRRSLNIDKDSSKNREFLAAFWDKLCLDEAKEIMSFTDVAIEEVAGPSIIRALSSWMRKPGFSSLSHMYVKAGAALLDIVQAKPSRFPISSKELFDILDDASEKTFLCAGTAVSLQKFVFDGEAGKIAMEMKNLVACTSFLLEQKLVKAWLADKDAEALRFQKLLVEEEEAAQKRQAELLERKRMKKLRQKEQKAKDLTTDADLTTDVSNKVSLPSNIDLTSGSGTPSPRAPSELYAQEASLGEDPCSLEPTGSPDPDAEANFKVLIGSICVTLGQKNDHCQDLSSLRCGHYQEKLAKTDSSMSNANCSGAKLCKPVACQENCDYATIRGDKRENNINGHSAETASQISLDKNPLASGGMDDGSSERYKDLSAVHRSTNVSGPMLLSIKDAEAFLARRWKEAIASDHVLLVLPPETEASDGFNNPEGNCTEAPMKSSDSIGRSMLGSADNQMDRVGSTELAFGASKPKFRVKPLPEKNCKLKYVPKQRNNTVGE